MNGSNHQPNLPSVVTLGTDQLALVLETIQDGVYVVDQERRILYWNRGAEQLSGYSAREVVGRFCHEGMLAHIDDVGRCLCRSGCPLAATICDRKTRQSDIYMHHKDGHRVPVHVEAAALVDPAGTLYGAVEVFNDNSSMESARRTIRTLTSMAMLDPLTGLPNRRYTEGRLRSAVRELQMGGAGLAIMMLDIDHFKRVNDRYGHDTGDRVLKMVARTCAGSVSLPAIAGRWGGEEFLIVAPDVNAAEARRIGERTRMLIEQCFVDTPSGILRVTASVGVTLATTTDEPDGLVERADKALYRSKADGRNRVTFNCLERRVLPELTV